MHAAIFLAVCALDEGVYAQAAADSITYAIPQRPNPQAELGPPTLRLDDSSGCEWYRIRGLVIQRDNTLVVANGGNHELCLFDQRGRYIRSIGRQGEGPGEFRYIAKISRYPGDSVLVYDFELRRVSIFDSEGTVGRMFRLPPPPPGLGLINQFASLKDGGLLVGYSEFLNGPPQPDPIEITQQLLHLDAKGQVLKILGRFPAGTLFIQKLPSPPDAVAYWDLTFGPRFTVAAGDGGFFAGDGHDWSVVEYDAMGEPQRSHILPLPLRPVVQDHIARYRRSQIDRSSDDIRSMTEKRVAEMPYPPTFPAYRAMLTGPDATLWLERYPAPGEAVSEWLVLDTRAGTARWHAAPARLRALAVGSDLLCGVAVDEFGRETVECYSAR